jgi:hypothetical protein
VQIISNLIQLNFEPQLPQLMAEFCQFWLGGGGLESAMVMEL